MGTYKSGLGVRALTLLLIRCIVAQADHVLPGDRAHGTLFICESCGFIRRDQAATAGVCIVKEHGKLRSARVGDIAKDVCRGGQRCQEQISRPVSQAQIDGRDLVLLACDEHRREEALV